MCPLSSVRAKQNACVSPPDSILFMATTRFGSIAIPVPRPRPSIFSQSCIVPLACEKTGTVPFTCGEMPIATSITAGFPSRVKRESHWNKCCPMISVMRFVSRRILPFKSLA